MHAFARRLLPAALFTLLVHCGADGAGPLAPPAAGDAPRAAAQPLAAGGAVPDATCADLQGRVDAAREALEASPEMAAYRDSAAYVRVQQDLADFEANDCGETVAPGPNAAPACAAVAARFFADSEALGAAPEAQALAASAAYQALHAAAQAQTAAGCGDAGGLATPRCRALVRRLEAHGDALARTEEMAALLRTSVALQVMAQGQRLADEGCAEAPQDAAECAGLQAQLQALLDALKQTAQFAALRRTAPFAALVAAATEGVEASCWEDDVVRSLEDGDFL